MATQCTRDICRCVHFRASDQTFISVNTALLRTCRLIYSEAVESLYTTNSFSLSTNSGQVPTLDYLSYYFRPHRLAAIRNLRIYWQIDRMPYSMITGSLTDSEIPGLYSDAWRKSWDCLSRMSGLRRLDITLSYRDVYYSDFYDYIWTEKAEEWLQPIKAITAPRHFVVTLPSHNCKTNVNVEPSKCVFELPEGDDILIV
ncbi:hypothetical protein GQ44DRAFT_618706 [Phaeosphaeriaceae sp. PMI808]|nr:hypothetical protein GQ44DRAFT_618706 [Phaeosphaeriaceae sp. PMI808]